VTTKEALARLLWAEMAAAGHQQQDVAASVGISEKHLSQMVNLKSGMSLTLVDQILAHCGRRLILATEPITQSAESETGDGDG
jgi:hypothetical protein